MSSEANLAQDEAEAQEKSQTEVPQFEERRCPACGRRVWIRAGREPHPCSRCAAGQPKYSWMKKSDGSATDTDENFDGKENQFMARKSRSRKEAESIKARVSRSKIKSPRAGRTKNKPTEPEATAQATAAARETKLINYTSPETFSAEAQEKFAEGVDKRGSGECWPWKKKGREFIYMGRGFNIGKYAYLAAHPEADRTASYRRTCETDPCANPAHVAPAKAAAVAKA